MVVVVVVFKVARPIYFYLFDLKKTQKIRRRKNKSGWSVHAFKLILQSNMYRMSYKNKVEIENHKQQQLRNKSACTEMKKKAVHR